MVFDLRAERLACLLIFVLTFAGCKKQLELPEKAPRAVTVMELKESTPQTPYNVSGSVQSWKTERIGFEVAGRLQWVKEPGQNVEGQIRDSDRNLIRQGTPLAKIDPARYEVALESAQAAWDVAKLDREVIQIRINDSLPSDIKSAEADVKLAEVEFQRMEQLDRQNAVAQSEYDAAKNQLQIQQARLANLRSSLRQATAELKAADARVKSAEQAHRDAKRDLDNTVLYGSYPGQISAVDVVPGSVISLGSPVLTLQMMDPIKIEIEVSAEQSREIQKRRQVPVTFTLSDGREKEAKAMVYLIDPSADASTRTFTVTLLLINEQFRPPLPERLKGLPVARTRDIWAMKISEIVGGTDGVFMVEESAIERDGDQDYVWLIKDVSFGETIPDLVKVERRNVSRGPIRLPFLGNWDFQQIIFEDKSIGKDDLLAGKLEFPDIDRSEWDGESLVVDSGEQWMLRPGDLVNVNLNPDQGQPGLFVPVQAIYEDLGETYVFVVVDGIAKKTQVKAVLPDTVDMDSLIRIEPMDSSVLQSGSKIVVGGVHYLNDGEQVRVVERVANDIDNPTRVGQIGDGAKQ